MAWKRSAWLAVAMLPCVAVVLADPTTARTTITSLDGVTSLGAVNRGVASPAAQTIPEPSENAHAARGGGDTCETATVIQALPFSGSGDSCLALDDYDEACPYQVSGGQDVVYTFTPDEDVLVDISLCENSAYDTRLYVYENVCGPYGGGTAIACNEDACSTPSHPDAYVSELTGITLVGGNTYYIVIDGYSEFECGVYTIDVTLAEPPPPPECPANSMFAQVVHGQDDFWLAGSSDVDVPEQGRLRYENFSGVVGSIDEVRFWGVDLWSNGFAWFECEEDPMTFEIKFYTDGGGRPSRERCAYTVAPTRLATGLWYNDYMLNEYSAVLDPPCTLTDGWVSIQGMGGDTTCWFLWMSTGAGDGVSWLDNGDSEGPVPWDFSLCLAGEYVPVFGACCDDSTGTCMEDVELIDCTSPYQRFIADGACEDFDPPCGTGACCHPDGNCEIVTEADCTDGDWLGANTTCEQCPCNVPCPAGGTPEQEACQDDDNGGCSSVGQPEFEPIACGETICGTAWLSDDVRDTDWYRLEITEDTELTIEVEAMFDIAFGLVENCGFDDCAASTGYADPARVAGPCEVTTLTTCLPPGVWWVFVAPEFYYEDFDCADGQGKYTVSLSCASCVPERGACCLYDGTCVSDVTECECMTEAPLGLGGAEWHPGFACEAVPCPQPLVNETCATAMAITSVPFAMEYDTDLAQTDDGLRGSCNTSSATVMLRDVWFTYTPSGDCLLSTTLNDYYMYVGMMAIYEGPDCDNLTEVACDSGSELEFEFTAYAGTTYWFQGGTWGTLDAGGDTTFELICVGAGGPGACCRLSGECEQLGEFQCYDAGGVYQGEGAACDPNPCFQPEPGDNCEAPIVVNVPGDLPYQDLGQYTCGRLNNYEETCVGSFDQGEDIVYQLVLEQPGGVEMMLDPKGVEGSALALYDVCPIEGDCIGLSVNLFSGTPHELECTELAAGTYYVLVDCFPPTGPECMSNFDLTIVSCGPLLGDLDGDGDVDLADLAQLLAHYGTTEGARYEDGDMDGDGDVDLADLAALLANYGATG